MGRRTTLDIPEGSALRGLALKMGSTVLFGVMGALVKHLARDYPVGQIVFARTFFALVPVFVMVQASGGLRVLRTENPFAHVQRSIAGMIGMFSGFAALAFIPLATATAIGFASPLLTTAFAAILLGEVVRRYRWSAVVVGLLGVLIMLVPIGAAAGVRAAALAEVDRLYILGAALALLGAVCGALATVSIRRMVATEPGVTIVFWFMSISAVAGAVSLLFQARMPTPLDAALFVAVGILGGLGQLSMTLAYREAPASTLAPLDYLAMVWALVIGYVWFGELPRAMVLAGAVVVVASGLFIIYREHKLGIERSRVRRAGAASTILK